MDNKILKPSLLVFAGPNGSGKSTIKSLFEIKGQYTNAFWDEDSIINLIV